MAIQSYMKIYSHNLHNTGYNNVLLMLFMKLLNINWYIAYRPTRVKNRDLSRDL